MPPGLDQEGLGDPIKSGEKIAEAKPKPDDAAHVSRPPKLRMARVATIEQPDKQAEGDEQNRPGMHGSKGEHRDGAGEHGEKSAPSARELRHPIGCGLHGRREHSAALGAIASSRACGVWMRSFLMCRGSASSTSNSMPLAWRTQLAPRRDAPGKREHETADRVDVLFLLRRDQIDAETLSMVSTGVRASAMRP